MTSEPRVRRGTVRIAGDVATRLRAGHPYLFRDALGGRPMREAAGDVLELVDPAGEFVAKGLYDPTGNIAVRIISRSPEGVFDADTIRRRVETAKRLREQLLPADGSTTYRIVHSEGDGIPGVTVDRYGDFLVSHLYTAAVEPLRDAIYDALEAVYKPRAIYEQKRYRPQTGEGPREPAQLVRGEVAPVEMEVDEGGVKFIVDVTAPLGTGLFLDLREGRKAVAQFAAGKRLLNLFSYTGAFSVYAAKAGATEVVSVDVSAKAHARARRNLTANGLDETRHEFIAGDAFKVLSKMAERQRQFDLIVLDPPSFGQSKDRGVFSVQKDYRELVEGCLAVAAPGALLAAVSNTLKISAEEIDRAIGDAAVRARRQVRLVERRGLPRDFPVPAGFLEGQYLKFFLCAIA
ncbi:MAG: putative methylase [Myxococcales bacterium]|nr:putative methylase [Myxococcales bacterium]